MNEREVQQVATSYAGGATDRVGEIIRTAPSVQLRIGELASVIYVALQTTASSNYDGFGTLTYYEAEGTREVLVQLQHARWQIERYLSMIGQRVEASSNTSGALVDLLWEQINKMAK